MSLSFAYRLPRRCCFNMGTSRSVRAIYLANRVDEATIRSHHIQLQQMSQCRRCELVHYHAAEALRVSAFLFACSSVLHIAHAVHWHNMHLWPWNLLTDSLSLQLLDCPKRLSPEPCLLVTFEFLWGGRSIMLPYHTLPFCLWIKVMNARLILCHYSVKKSLWFSLQATKIRTNRRLIVETEHVRFCYKPFQHFGDLSGSHWPNLVLLPNNGGWTRWQLFYLLR